MTDVEKLRRDLDEYKAMLFSMRNKVDALERHVRDVDSHCMELQGRCATLTGRIERMIR
ncbi:MAG: hypothetical protein PHO67_08265 [Candidatus Omnitrophica bacterium]|nr:hypothetical protein [Candidatus Omnitrophota bacterium]